MNRRREPTHCPAPRRARGTKTYLPVITAALCATGLWSSTGCVTPQERAYGIRSLDFTDFRGHADFVVREQKRQIESKTAKSRTRSKETIFEESLTLETDGFVLHPNILEFALGGMFGLVQEHFREQIDARTRDATNNGSLIEFDADAHILKNRAYPTTLFAHRHRGLIPRPFLPSLETTTTVYGVTWQYVSKTFPTNLRFSDSDTKISPLFITSQGEQDGRQKTTELRFETAYVHSEDNKLSLVFDHKSVEEQPFALDYDADELTVSHDLAFGKEHKHRLRSEFNYLDQRGTIDIERLRWREDLRLKHTATLESRYEFELRDRKRGNRSRDVPPTEERSYLLAGSVRHQLYQSQTTQLRLFVQRQYFEPDLEITRYGGQFNLNYRKKNPWGLLQASYGARIERVDHRGQTQTAEVIEEVHTFSDTDRITLSSQRVIESSITIRAQDRLTYYQFGRDYTWRVIGDVVEIERKPTGRIAAGETVLIDYIYYVGGTFKLDTVAQNVSVRQDFTFGLSPYYRLEWQDQTLTPPDTTSAIAEDITAHIVGVEYQRASLRLYAEYEDRDSTINPFKSTRLGASYTHRFNSGAESSLHARWTDTDYEPPYARELELLTLEARHRQPITPDFAIEGSVLYRDGDDTFAGKTDGVDAAFSLEWTIRETEIRLTFEYNDYEDRYARNEASALFIHIRRSF